MKSAVRPEEKLMYPKSVHKNKIPSASHFGLPKEESKPLTAYQRTRIRYFKSDSPLDLTGTLNCAANASVFFAA